MNFARHLLILLFGLSVGAESWAQVRTPPVMNLSCVASVGARCVLRSPHRTLDIVTRADVGLVAVLGGADAFQLSVQQDLLDRVDRAELSAEQALEVQSELSSFDGTSYELPTVEELRAALGFPVGADLDHEDLHDLICAHVQLTLGVGVITAGYLADRMGVQVVDEPLAVEALVEAQSRVQ